MEEDIKEIEIIIETIKDVLQKEIKDTDEDVYSIDGRQFRALENLLTRYKRMKLENQTLKNFTSDIFDGDVTKDFIPKSKVKEKIEEIKEYDYDGEHYSPKSVIKILQELLGKDREDE